jgi:hypothetical protein
MLPKRDFFVGILLVSLLVLLLACGDSEKSASPMASSESASEAPSESASAVEPAGESAEAETAAAAGAADEDAEEIEPSSLSQTGQIELKQYTVAYIGSGTVGGGTLILNGTSHPFKIAGLGIGGIGASSIDATGKVYNLPNLEAFPGSYGNARLGITAGDSGKGRLWLKNSDGVVIELWTKMRGLALTGGVDGILIEWDDGSDTVVGKTVEGSAKVVGGAIEVGADVVEGSLDAIKKPFQ